MHRVVIDTNLWISYLISSKYDFLDDLIERDVIKIIYSEALLQELLDVTSRPKFKKYFHKDDVLCLMHFIYQNAEFIECTTTVEICRDEKDNFLLGLAIDSEADFLLSGDMDLLVLEKIGSTEILNISEFKYKILSN